MDSHPHHGSCKTGEQKIDIQLDALVSSAPTEESLPARIMAKSRDVSAQSGHAAVYSVGMDVGSTTVKAVIVNAATDEIIWRDYQRHETKQPEKTLEFLKRMQDEAGIAPHNCRIFITGSGGGALADLVGAKFVQEVDRCLAGSREAASRSEFGDRAWRAGCQDHRLQRGREYWPQEKDPIDE